MYKKIDTVHNGKTDSIFIYSTNADSAKYSFNFIDVGANKGNYIPLFNAANGNVYQWVQPVNGVPQGNFEAATFLVTPKKQQVVNTGFAWQIDNKTLLKGAFAFSDYDINTYSIKDKQNDKGYASKIDFSTNRQYKNKKVKCYS